MPYCIRQRTAGRAGSGRCFNFGAFGGSLKRRTYNCITIVGRDSWKVVAPTLRHLTPFPPIWAVREHCCPQYAQVQYFDESTERVVKLVDTKLVELVDKDDTRNFSR
jgi:hypothetical protein